MRRFLPLLLTALACGTPPELLPPPFGPVGVQPARLFFPTGMAVTPEGNLIVANGNFDHAFDASTAVVLSKAYLDTVFARGLHCEKATNGVLPATFPDGCDEAIPQSAFLGAVLIGNYAGPLVFDAARRTAYTGSRDTNRLEGVTVDANGALGCAAGISGADCRQGVVDLAKAATLEGPYSIVQGFSRLPGTDTDLPTLFVASLIPHIDTIANNQLYTSGTIAALDPADPSQVRFSMLASSYYIGSGAGVGPMIFDPARRQLLMSGCYQRFSNSTGGDPGTGKCSGVANSLRVLDVDSGAAAQVRLYDLTAGIRSTETTQLLFGDGDAVTPATTLWATMRNPDALVELSLPTSPSQQPAVKHAISLPLSPGDVARVQRPGKSDLIVVSDTVLGAVAVYDVGEQQIVAQVERLGDTPFTLTQLPAVTGAARFAVSVFGSCRVALLEVPLDHPWDAALRGRAGSCP